MRPATSLMIAAILCSLCLAEAKETKGVPQQDATLGLGRGRVAWNPLDALGGPDPYGYRYEDNLQSDTATFQWIELCGDQNASDGPTGDDETAVATWGWNFPFYGSSYTSVNVSTNGLLQFVTSNGEFSNTCPFGPADPPDPEIAVYWDDLYAQTGGGCNQDGNGPWIRWRDFGTQFVVEWSHVPHFPNSSDRYTFEAIFYPSGRIKTQYLNITAPANPNSASIGIDRPGSRYGLEYLTCDASTLPDGTTDRAVWFYPNNNQPPDSLWSCSFGGSEDDYCTSAQQTSDGGYILAGLTNSFGVGGNAYVVKTDGTGNGIWTRSYGGNNADYFNAVQQTSDNGYVFAGGTDSYGAGNGDFWLMKTNSNGDSLWSRAFGGSGFDVCTSAQQTSEGGYVMAGATTSYGAGGWDFYMVKTDASGNQLWTRTFGGAGDEGCRMIRQTGDGGYLLVGYTDSFGAGGYDFYIVKTDGNGNQQWSREYGGSGNELCNSFVQISGGGYVLAGYTTSSGAGGYDSYLVRIDGSGNELWNRTYGGSSYDWCNSAQQASDGGFILGGFTQSFAAGFSDYWLVKVDGNGDYEWSLSLGGDSLEECNTVMQTTDGGYALAGRTTSFGAGGEDIWLVRTGPDVQAASDHPRGIAREFTLRQNYPNPFNATTTISYQVVHVGRVTVKILNLLGQEVETLVDEVQPEGQYKVVLDASGWASGIYLCRLQTTGGSDTKKMMLLK